MCIRDREGGRLHQGGAQAVVPGTLAETGSREDRAPPLHDSEDYSGGDLLTYSGGRRRVLGGVDRAADDGDLRTGRPDGADRGDGDASSDSD